MIRRLVAALMGVVVLGACAGKFHSEKYPTPEALYDAALAEYQKGDCGKATTGFQALTFELPPRDPRQADARYYLAECQLRDKERLEAARNFRRVSDEFPQHRLAPDALLRAGDANAELWRNPELDPTYGETGLAVYRELLARYPDSEAATKAKERIAVLNNMLAEKEFKTGVFYLRLRAYDSAILYFRSVVETYPQSRSAPQALLKLVETYDKIRYAEEKQEICQHLQRYYPDTPNLAEVCPTPPSQRTTR